MHGNGRVGNQRGGCKEHDQPVIAARVRLKTAFQGHRSPYAQSIAVLAYFGLNAQLCQQFLRSKKTVAFFNAQSAYADQGGYASCL